MSKYVIIHGQLYELPEDELMHWKYIKREKVNGKWKYIYDLGETQKKNYETAKKNYYGQVNRIKSIRAKNINGIKVGSDHYSVANTKKKHALKEKMREAETEYYNTPLGKRERRADNVKQNVAKVKNWTKDKLGYDEKQAMESAKVGAKIARRDADDTAKKNADWKSKNPDDKNIKELADWQTGFKYELAAESWAKAKKATEKYEKTPLAKFEKMKDRIDSAKELVHELATNERGEKARKELQDASNALSNALAKEDYHRKKYEEVLSKTKNQEYFDKDHGNTSMVNEWKKDVDDARKESEAALERVKKARSEYDATPMGKREKRKTYNESTKNRVNEIIEDRKKARVSESKSSPKGVENNAKEKIIPEKVIKENVIKENVIKENIIPQEYIYEKRMTEEELREEAAKKRKNR